MEEIKMQKILQVGQATSLHASMFRKSLSKSRDEPDTSSKQLLKWYNLLKEIFYNPTDLHQSNWSLPFLAKIGREIFLH
ncbi:MAG: hypothetical protein QXQ40_01090 [Candidatus Aenigmatarchaeota archaeon]